MASEEGHLGSWCLTMATAIVFVVRQISNHTTCICLERPRAITSYTNSAANTAQTACLISWLTETADSLTLVTRAVYELRDDGLQSLEAVDTVDKRVVGVTGHVIYLLHVQYADGCKRETRTDQLTQSDA